MLRTAIGLYIPGLLPSCTRVWRRSTGAIFLLALCLISLPRTAPDAAPRPSPPDPREIWVLSHQSLTPAERVLAQTLQGLANRKGARVWLRAGGMYHILEERLRKEGWKVHEVGSVWDLLRRFRAEVRGSIAFRLGTPSLNAATSLSGIMGGIAVDESLLSRVHAEGLQMLVDARGMDERQVHIRYREQLSRRIAVEQSIEKPGHLRDFAVARRAFTFATSDPGFRTEVARAYGPEAVVYGWGDDEFQWVSALSRANASGAPADWCLNLSALQHLDAGRLRRPRRQSLKVEDGVRYVAFVMSDGDNIQWLCGNFATDPRYWASPLRGRFPMTWEVSPLLVEVAPRVLSHLYATATSMDAFVSGPGAPGYTFPHFQPDPKSLARQAAPLLHHSDLSIVSVLNSNDGSPQETNSLLDLPGVGGVLYKAYSPYHRLRGAISWHRSKPCVSYRFVLWERLMEPKDLAREVAKMPAAPQADEQSYALVNVHAWSFQQSGGPLEAVRRAIDLLPPNTRVVTADQLIAMLRANFGRRHALGQHRSP